MNKGLQKLLLTAGGISLISILSGCASKHNLNTSSKCQYNDAEIKVYNEHKARSKGNSQEKTLVVDNKGYWQVYYGGDFKLEKGLLYPARLFGKGEFVLRICDEEIEESIISFSGDLLKMGSSFFNQGKFNLLSYSKRKDLELNEFIALRERQNVVVYSKLNNQWHRRSWKASEFNKYKDTREIVRDGKLGEKINCECVEPYIGLIKDIKNNYFHKFDLQRLTNSNDFL